MWLKLRVTNFLKKHYVSNTNSLHNTHKKMLEKERDNSSVNSLLTSHGFSLPNLLFVDFEEHGWYTEPSIIYIFQVKHSNGDKGIIYITPVLRSVFNQHIFCMLKPLKIYLLFQSNEVNLYYGLRNNFNVKNPFNN